MFLWFLEHYFVWEWDAGNFFIDKRKVLLQILTFNVADSVVIFKSLRKYRFYFFLDDIGFWYLFKSHFKATEVGLQICTHHFFFFFSVFLFQIIYITFFGPFFENNISFLLYLNLLNHPTIIPNVHLIINKRRWRMINFFFLSLWQKLFINLRKKTGVIILGKERKRIIRLNYLRKSEIHVILERWVIWSFDRSHVFLIYGITCMLWV